MMRRIVWFCAAMMIAASAHAESGELQGSWTARIAKEHPGKLYISLETGPKDQHGSHFERSAFRGLSTSDIESKARVPVQFELQREAGTVAFEGSFRDGRGAGDFTFVSNPEFQRRLRSVGVRLESKSVNHNRELLNLALFDVSIEFIRSMQGLGYDEPLDTYVAFRIFNIDPEYVRRMEAAGFARLSADKLTSTRIHGATPEYIKQMRAAGNDLTLDQYIESRIFQITPEFAEAMRRLGYARLDRDMLVQFRIHGVTPDFVEELREVGYSRVPAENLVAMRIHGVTPAFIRRVARTRDHKVSVEKLIEMRIFNVDPEEVNAFDER